MSDTRSVTLDVGYVRLFASINRIARTALTDKRLLVVTDEQLALGVLSISICLVKNSGTD